MRGSASSPCSAATAPEIMLLSNLSPKYVSRHIALPCSDFSEVNDFLSNLLGWGQLFQTTWCGSGGSARYTILAPTNKARHMAVTAHPWPDTDARPPPRTASFNVQRSAAVEAS